MKLFKLALQNWTILNFDFLILDREMNVAHRLAYKTEQTQRVPSSLGRIF